MTDAQAKQEAANWAAADIRVITPGVVNASGLPDLGAGYTKTTGKKVAIRVIGMGTIVQEIKTMTPPADLGPEVIDRFIAASQKFSELRDARVEALVFGPVELEKLRRFVLIHSAHHLNYFEPK